ncbi:MAG: biotin/lipoyl-binding protein [Dehalococcoidia bacterium]|nr:biotin/lipoyl-binding protein [Dehalococcoidia bacterium]
MSLEITYHIQVADDTLEVTITPEADDSLLVTINGTTRRITLIPAGDGLTYFLTADGIRRPVYAAADAQSLELLVAGDLFSTARVAEPGPGGQGSVSAGSGPLTLKAPMPGVVKDVLVAQGDHVEQGAPLVVLEAMKMNNQIRSPRAGSVVTLAVTPGQRLNRGDALLTLS